MNGTPPDFTAWPRSAGPVEVRLATPDDIPAVLRWRNRPEVTRWLIHTHADAESLSAAWAAPTEERRSYPCVVDHEGRVVGTVSLEVYDAMGQPPGDDWRNAEGHIGYLIDPDFAGRGFASSAATSMLDLAFRDLGLHRVTAGCFADNTASWRIMEKLGMRREQYGVKNSWHAELGWIDGFTYAILREEWLTAS